MDYKIFSLLLRASDSKAMLLKAFVSLLSFQIMIMKILQTEIRSKNFLKKKITGLNTILVQYIGGYIWDDDKLFPTPISEGLIMSKVEKFNITDLDMIRHIDENRSLLLNYIDFIEHDSDLLTKAILHSEIVLQKQIDDYEK